MIYLNGSYLPPEKANIAITDRGLLLGDGLFETLRIYSGNIFALKEHLERLKKSAELLEIPLKIDLDTLKNIIENLLTYNSIPEKSASCRITITRGEGPRGLNYPEKTEPTILITVSPYVNQTIHPAKLIISKIKRDEDSPLTSIKSISYLNNVFARREAFLKKCDEAILLNSKGNIAETTAANIFLVTQNDELITPSLDQGLLPGITRMKIIELAKELKISVKERAIKPEELKTAKEIFLTNALIEIQPVKQIENHHLKCSTESTSITCQLQRAYRKLTEKKPEINTSIKIKCKL